MEDVARFARITFEGPGAGNRLIEIGGPENLTLNQVAEIFENMSGCRAKKRYVPLPMMRIMSSLIQLINPALSRQIRLGIYLDTANLCYDMTETLKVFPLPLTHLKEWVRYYYRRQEAR